MAYQAVGRGVSGVVAYRREQLGFSLKLHMRFDTNSRGIFIVAHNAPRSFNPCLMPAKAFLASLRRKRTFDSCTKRLRNLWAYHTPSLLLSALCAATSRSPIVLPL